MSIRGGGEEGASRIHTAGASTAYCLASKTCAILITEFLVLGIQILLRFGSNVHFVLSFVDFRHSERGWMLLRKVSNFDIEMLIDKTKTQL